MIPKDARRDNIVARYSHCPVIVKITYIEPGGAMFSGEYCTTGLLDEAVGVVPSYSFRLEWVALMESDDNLDTGLSILQTFQLRSLMLFIAR